MTTTTQPELPFALPGSIERAFRDYHRDNPHIFRLLVRFTQDLKGRGIEHYGIKAVFERIRWETDITAKDPSLFKLNNNYTSRYVRLLEEKHPEFTGFYRTRELKAA